MSGVPAVVARLLTACLGRDPTRRPAPRTAATVVQLLLWAPSTWGRQGGRPDTQAVLQWLLTVTTKLVCEARYIQSFYVDLSSQTVELYVVQVGEQCRCPAGVPAGGHLPHLGPALRDQAGARLHTRHRVVI